METAWSDALATSQRDTPPVVLATDRGKIIERRQVAVAAPADRVFAVVKGIGGARGVGDALDFWRVEALDEGRMLRLRAEMRVPGRAWLQFEVRAVDPTAATIVQTAFFAPKGLPGLAYGYGPYPAHKLIFSGLVREIASRAEREAGGAGHRGAVA